MSKSEIDKIKAVLSDLKNADIEDYVLNLTKALEVAVNTLESISQAIHSDKYKYDEAQKSLKQISAILEAK